MLDFWQSGFEGILFTIVLYGVGWLVTIAMSVRAFWRGALEKPSRCFWGLLLLGLALRLGWIVVAQPDPISDYAGYWRAAEQLAAGDFTFTNIDKHPGIIILLAATRAFFGNQYWPVWCLNLLLSTGILTFIYMIARRLFNRTTALVALALAALQPQLIAYSALFASELPTLYLYLALIWFTLETRDNPTQKGLQWIGLGFVLYTAVLTRSTSLVFGMLTVAIVLLFRRDAIKANLKGLLTFGLTAGILLSSWLYHQYLLTGKAQLFWGGEIWLVSTTHYETESRLVNPRALPGLKDKIAAAIQGKTGPQSRLAELAEDRKWAMAIYEKNPARYFEAGKTRLRHILWTTSETGIRDTQWGSAALAKLGDKTMTRLAEISKHIWRVTLIFSLLGLLLSAFNWKRFSASAKEGLLMMTGFLLIWLIFHYLMAVASDRWAVQIIPFVLLFAANGVTTVITTLIAALKANPLYTGWSTR